MVIHCSISILNPLYLALAIVDGLSISYIAGSLRDFSVKRVFVEASPASSSVGRLKKSRLQVMSSA